MSIAWITFHASYSDDLSQDIVLLLREGTFTSANSFMHARRVSVILWSSFGKTRKRRRLARYRKMARHSPTGFHRSRHAGVIVGGSPLLVTRRTSALQATRSRLRPGASYTTTPILRFAWTRDTNPSGSASVGLRSMLRSPQVSLRRYLGPPAFYCHEDSTL